MGAWWGALCCLLKIANAFWITEIITILFAYTTQQNSYSISHLLGTVTTTVTAYSLFSIPQHRDYWAVTTLDSHAIRYPLPWGLCRNLSTRHLVGNCTVTTWMTLGTRYTQSLCRNQGGTDTWFCSLPLVPLLGERIATTSSLSSHSTVTIWGVLLCTCQRGYGGGSAPVEKKKNAKSSHFFW